MKYCLECNDEITSKYAKKFCSKSCSAKYTNRIRYKNGYSLTVDQRKIISNKLKLSRYIPNNIGRKISEREFIECKECGSLFEKTVKSKKLYCSSICSRKNIGGYREGSGKAYTGYYNGIYCGSTYELCWVIYNLDHNIPFTRFVGVLVGCDIKYIPDFLMADGKTIVEIKGYEPEESVERKTKLAESYGYTVKVLRKNDLSHIFEYVKSKYSANFKTLYTN